MARLARLTLPAQVHQVMHRGNNCQPVVHDDVDRQHLLDLIGTQAVRCQVALHAYCILPDQFQLLATPAGSDGLPRMMQAIGRDYVRWFNARHKRSGTLWEGRYRSTLIQASRHLLSCMAYLDLAPVREGLCSEPMAYAWSSHRHYIGHEAGRRMTPHAEYWQLGNTPFAREAAYADLVHAGLSAQQVGAIAHAVWRGWALGDAVFVEQVQSTTERRLLPVRPGRPRKTENR